MSGRDPDAILAELGAALEGAWAGSAETRRSRRRFAVPRLRGGRRGLVVAAAAALALVPTAIATRDAVWAPDPPPLLPERLRAPDGVAPAGAGAAVYVGAGTQRGVAWKLSATTCRYGTIEAVGLFLSVPGGGAGARCDAGGTNPRALAARRVQTYYDPASNQTWAFGALPAGAAIVTVISRAYGGGAASSVQLAAQPVDGDAIAQGHLPRGLRVFAVALDGGRDVASVRIDDAAGQALLTCAPTTPEAPCRPAA
ncbi:hypothetical protein DSM104299_00774 [Baekduia alba]|uniref:hypothetical protein n=1 Tax=Baekduia alba TaxID=2997333 RepID=UPI00233FE1E7|nr:hypothetical protein [Baekduia alba]WCB92091.1 hypothetical protein DSM104299_00774 [Baekduia alba]